ncbi:DUF4129 domain-containing protein [Halovenus marina]|uniref:DUF4129 domain-containing protein n=1 Tax=Halovenus marina TaxID=3396621 RepID=UPI003F579F31
MNRRTLAVAVIAALAVLAVGFAAATLSSTVATESDGVGGNESSEGVVNFQQPTPQETNSSVAVPQQVGNALFVLFAIGSILSLVYVAKYWRQYLPQLAGVVVLGLLLYGLLLVDFDLPSLLSGGDGRGNLGGDLFGDGEGRNVGSLSTTEYELLALLGVLVFAVTVYRLQFASGPDRTRERETAPRADQTETAAPFGAQTGVQAVSESKLDDSAENEVYRAWEEMVEHLDVDDPDSTTPGEFASAAVDAGMQREDVTDLTHLFEDVRYGGQDPTDSREQQAREIRERIDESADRR